MDKFGVRPDPWDNRIIVSRRVNVCMYLARRAKLAGDVLHVALAAEVHASHMPMRACPHAAACVPRSVGRRALFTSLSIDDAVCHETGVGNARTLSVSGSAPA